MSVVTGAQKPKAGECDAGTSLPYVPLATETKGFVTPYGVSRLNVKRLSVVHLSEAVTPKDEKPSLNSPAPAPLCDLPL